MTPEERELVADLFARLAELERSPRDPDAERTIREGLARAPNAVYALVQTALLQDEALKTANDRITELEDSLEQAQTQQRERSFLDRSGGASPGKWNTGEVLRGGGSGSVPSVRPGEQPMGVPPGYDRDRGHPGESYRDEPGRGGYGGPQGGGYGGPQGGGYGSPMGGEPGRGGSFLGTAAAVAAGAIGGGLLLSGIRSALGGQSGQGGQDKGPFSGAFDKLTGNKSAASGSGDLARDAGLGDIDKSGGGGFGAADLGDNDKGGRFGAANIKDQNFDADDSALDDGSMEDFSDDAFDDDAT
jgi:uncharacterized protein